MNGIQRQPLTAKPHRHLKKTACASYPVENVKVNDTANSRPSGGGRDFELDSKFDFLYSEILEQFRLGDEFDAKVALAGNTII